jgi:hypothetical protein
MRRVSSKTAIECFAQWGSCLLRQLGKVQIPAGALQKGPKCNLALSGYYRIGFPVTRLLAILDAAGTFIDRHTVWNVAFPVLSAVASTQPFLMGSDQMRYQVHVFAHLGIVDVLVDGFVADT